MGENTLEKGTTVMFNYRKSIDSPLELRYGQVEKVTDGNLTIFDNDKNGYRSFIRQNITNLYICG